MVGPSLSPKASTRIASAVFAASTLLIFPLFFGVAYYFNGGRKYVCMYVYRMELWKLTLLCSMLRMYVWVDDF